eukprot:2417157-Amphidinium_carterae.1
MGKKRGKCWGDHKGKLSSKQALDVTCALVVKAHVPGYTIAYATILKAVLNENHPRKIVPAS